MRLALLGTCIGESRSPSLHMEEAKAQGIELHYELIDFDQIGGDCAIFGQVLTDLQRQGYGGVNVTHPFKQKALKFVDDLSPDAALIGSVNTIVFRNGRREGFNTDWSGYVEAFQREFNGACLDHVVQIGAGGAGAAVAYALLQLGAKHLEIFELDEELGGRVVANLSKSNPGRVILGKNLVASTWNASGLVNCTPVGMAKYPGLPVPAPLLRASMWVSDIIYFPRETELLRLAKSAGARASNGSIMNIYQGAYGFELFTGMRANVERMLRRHCLEV